MIYGIGWKHRAFEDNEGITSVGGKTIVYNCILFQWSDGVITIVLILRNGGEKNNGSK